MVGVTHIVLSTSVQVLIALFHSQKVCSEQISVAETGQFNVLSAKGFGLSKVGLLTLDRLVSVEIGDGGIDSVSDVS